jgi:hypothetical protein
MRVLRWLFLATLSLVLMVQLRLIDGPLTSPDTPGGIVGFELAFTGARATAIMAVWRSMGVTDNALVSLGVDVGFLLVYPFMFRSLVLLLQHGDGSAFQRLAHDCRPPYWRASRSTRSRTPCSGVSSRPAPPRHWHSPPAWRPRSSFC